VMVIHPPMLYLGYVGMTVPFGVAAAALLRGEIAASWMVPLRRWTLLAWTFLTVGIILGSWWAYAVLGWGGYWAWDPVENASFLPWLTATAFMHSTMVQERKKMLKLWTISLALASFVLTILGTFMTRSGVFNSVHSFTQSDIGPTFLGFIALLLVFCVGLLATRGHLLVAEENIKSPLSRETMILLNNLVFAALTFVVLLGTLHPLIAEGVFNKRVSVGAPYFDKLTGPFWVAMLFLMGVGPMLPWGSADRAKVRGQFLLPSGGALVTLALCFAFGLRGFYPLAIFALATFVTLITVRELAIPVQLRMREKGEGFLTALTSSAGRARRRFGGYIVHLGIVMVAVAVAASSAYVTNATATLSVGETFTLNGYELKFLGLTGGQEPGRQFVAARVAVLPPGGGEARELLPRMNYYLTSTDPVGTPAVRSTAAEDLYLSLLAYSPAAKSPSGKETASFNSWVFPLVGWIWWSIPVMVLGSLVAIWPNRKTKVVLAATPAAVSGGPAPGTDLTGAA
jgi:cytochrome c-type biogenesis protein CcmF